MDDASSLEVLAPADEGESVGVEDVLEAEEALEEIGEAQAPATPFDVPWDISPEEAAKAEKLSAQSNTSPFGAPGSQEDRAKPPVQAAEELDAEELTIDSGEEVAEELPIALTEEEPAEAAVEPAEEVAAKAPEPAAEEVSEEALELATEEAPEAAVEEISAEAPELSVAEAAAETPTLAAEEVSMEEAPKLSVEDVSSEKSPESEEEAPTEALELPAEELSAGAESEPAQARVMPSEEVVAEAQVAQVGEPVTQAPRQPVDLGELPPVPEEPMQLAATWEFMGMAESQASAAPTAQEERALELDTSLPAMPEYTGNAQDEVALAPTWDFVPQWQPQEEPPKSEPSASAAPPVAEEPAPAVSPDTRQDVTSTAKYGVGNAQPTMTGKYGIVSAEPEPSQAVEPDSEKRETTGVYGALTADQIAEATEEQVAETPESASPELTMTDKYGIGTGEPAKTGKYGTAEAEVLTTAKFGIGIPDRSSPEASAAPETAQPGSGEEQSWDQMLSGAEPELPAAEPLAPEAESDPFAEFAAEAARAKAPAPAPAPTSAPVPRPPRPPGSSGEGSGS